jgi:flagellar hook-associated protein 1 FlgK
MDIQSFTRADDTMVVLTAGGKTLVNGIAEKLTFSPSGTASASAPLSKVTVNGIDITSEIKGGSIGGLLQMRDTQLPALTAELNQFTQSLFNTVQTPPSAQIQTITGTIAAGDTYQVTIDGTVFNTAALGANPSAADLVNAINAQLGATTFKASVSNGNNVLITDSAGNPLTSTIVQTAGTGVTFTPSTTLATSNSGTSALGDAAHFFAGVDTRPGNPPPVPALNIDNAATITVNPSLVANPTLLNGSVANPDPTIAQRLSDALALTVQSFPPAGNFPAPLTTTLSGYAAQILGQNATAAATASSNSTFQTGVQTEISTRASSVSGVNMDEELANLQIYQTAYSASARVIQAVQSMFDSLLAIQP